VDDFESDFLPSDDGHSGLYGTFGSQADDGFLHVPASISEHMGSDREKLHSLPYPTAPLGMIAKLSLDARSRSRSRSRSARSKSVSSTGRKPRSNDTGNNSDDLGVANDDYFSGQAANLDLRAALLVNQPPEIMVHGLVTPEDVENLFKIFYDKLNPFLSILDPKLHTPASTFSRCPFLFTVICALSSRYYDAKSSIYPIAMLFAKQAAARNLIEGWKCVEQCQAYLLMSVYAMPARKWEDDRSWLYLGVAIRVATDLNLHHPTAMKFHSELHEREIHNRTRTWMILFNLDRSTSTQLGKPSTIREDFITQSDEWYKSSQYNHPYDIHLCAYSQLLRMVAKFHTQIYDGPLGLKPNIDIHKLTLRFDTELDEFQERTARSFQKHTEPGDEGSAFRCRLLPFLVDYSRLVMFSFGFQRAFQQGLKKNDYFLGKVLNTALNVLKCFVESLAPSGYMKYSPDGHFIFVSFASAFLIKLLRAKLVTDAQRGEALQAIQRLIEALSSPEVAIDEKHTPKLYARFLKTLITEQLVERDEENFNPPSATDSSTEQQQTSSGAETDRQKGPIQAPQVQPQPQPLELEEQEEPQTPSISLEYAPIGGEPHVQVLQDSMGQDVIAQQRYHPMMNTPSTFAPQYDERFSASSSTVGGRGEDGDNSTQHGGTGIGDADDGNEHLNRNEMLASMNLLSNPQFFDHMMMPPYNPASWDQAAMAVDLQNQFHMPPQNQVENSNTDQQVYSSGGSQYSYQTNDFD